MTTPQLMAFIPSSAAVAAPEGSSVLYDWLRNQVYAPSPGASADSGLRQFDGYATGDETYAKTIAQLGITDFLTSGVALTQSGYLVGNEFLSNSTTLWEVYGPTGALVNQFGISSSSLAPSDGTRILTPGSMARLRWGKTDSIIACPLVSGVGEICILRIPGLGNVNLGAITEDRGFCGPGAVGATTGTAFVLGRSAGLTNLGLYKVTATALGASMARSGSITPASIDATWTDFTAAAGCAYDQTDGNVIIYCHSFGHTNNDYLVKVNAATAAVIWTCPINSSAASVDLAQCLITRQILYYLGSSHLLYTINTATGVATTQTVGSLTPTGAVISEDVYGSIIGFGSWVETTTHPQYIGTYMGTGGTHTFTNAYFRYMPNGAITPPTPTTPKPGIVSTNRTWSFVLDGHTFYVLDLGTQGTFLFDTVTGEWSEFQTAGGNWNMVNGCMWGQRIVAGDIATSDLWELDPAATKDSGGTYELTHVVTGGLSTRSRTFVSLSALRVTASFGVVDDSGVTFNLRFSDDQGNTWSAYYPITLTAGDFGAELAWTSMGSFMAPGRLFELSDAGGLIRIDGCDAFLDGFDNDAPGQDGSDGS